MKANTRQAKWPAIVFLVSRAPRTRRQLRELCGCKETTVVRALDRLEEEGLITRSEKPRKDGARGPATLVFEWVQP